MSEVASSPGRAEVEEIAQLLASIDATSKHDLRYILSGDTDWRLAHSVIKRCVKRLINDPTRKLRRDHRLRLLEYASTWGLRLNPTLADVPMTVVKRFKVTPDMSDEIEEAALNAGHDETTWMRNVVMAAARRARHENGGGTGPTGSVRR